jgi:hypothetical protein
MYNENKKIEIYKWRNDNRSHYNEYQKQKQKEYYKNNTDVKLRKKKEYIFRKISAEFRNILF